jgi:uncharacterized protein (TIGR02646 family)
MLRLNRPPSPNVFASAELAHERKYARDFFARKMPSRSQERFKWDRVIRLLRQTDAQLLKISNGKCAYCESTVAVREDFNLEMFRPKAGAISREGDVAPNHYWWLAFEWSNLLPACQACNVAKASRFPTMAPRARAEATGNALADEQPLLLDPCLDDPSSHLVFDEQGLVSSPTERGRVTIEVVALNREPLVEARRQEITLLRTTFALLRTGGNAKQRSVNATEFLKRSANILDVKQPYLAAKRQLLALWLRELPEGELAAKAIKALESWVPNAFRVGAEFITRATIKSAQSSFRTHQAEKERHSVEAGSKTAKVAYFGGVRRIERIVIENFKGIRHLELTVPLPSAQRESWLMLVGENATGKSSVLHAVALALLGQNHIAKLGLDARTFVTHGQTRGSAFVHLTNVSEPVVLSYTKQSRGFLVHPPAELVLLLGYGATRLLPRSATTKKTPSRYVRVKNLFNPYARLQNAESWLTNRRVVKAPLFQQIAVALKQLLLLDDSSRILRERFRVLVEIGGHKISLRELSDGYQSIVALAVDIMMGLAVRWSSMDVAEGVVLIDELEAHLHPRWKMEIVTRLRRVFPKLTFIATTHDPLCLRGLEPGEIVVLRRQKDQIAGEVIAESVANLRADQLLTSELFGLYSTRDPDINAAIVRHTALSSAQSRSPDEETELQELSGLFAGKLQTGETAMARAVERTWQEVVEHQVLPQVRRQLGDSSLIANLPQAAQRALQSLFGHRQ